MEYPRQAYWSKYLPFPSPEDLPNPGIKPVSPALASGFFTAEPSGKPHKVPFYIVVELLSHVQLFVTP